MLMASIRRPYSPSAVLVFSSFVGYTTEEITVGNQTQINVTLLTSTADLAEVVVMGYGTQVKELIGGSVAQVDAPKLKNMPQAGIEQLLPGRSAGGVHCSDVLLQTIHPVRVPAPLMLVHWLHSIPMTLNHVAD